MYLQHCVKSVQIRSFSGPYFPAFGLNTGTHGPEKTEPHGDGVRVFLLKVSLVKVMQET